MVAGCILITLTNRSQLLDEPFALSNENEYYYILFLHFRHIHPKQKTKKTKLMNVC